MKKKRAWLIWVALPLGLAAWGIQAGGGTQGVAGSDPRASREYWATRTGLAVQVDLFYRDGKWVIKESVSLGNHPSALGYPHDNHQSMFGPPPFGSFPVWRADLALVVGIDANHRCAYQVGRKGSLQDFLSLDKAALDARLTRIRESVAALEENARWVDGEGWRAEMAARPRDTVRGGLSGIEGRLSVTVREVPAVSTAWEWYLGFKSPLWEFTYFIDDPGMSPAEVRESLVQVMEEDLPWIHGLEDLFLLDEGVLPFYSSRQFYPDCSETIHWQAFFPSKSTLLFPVLGRGKRWVEVVD